jgi:hypothetical protein
VLPSALAALGVEGWANPLGLPAASSYVVLLVDGLGWNLLRRHAALAPYLSSLAARGRSITAGVPSTTATSITSLGTGLPPGEHGVVGYTSRIPGTGRLLDALRWDAKVDPLAWQPNPPVFERAAARGVPVTVVSRGRFERSGLTIAGQRGAAYVGADYAGERIAATIAAAERTGSLTYLYDGDLDSTGHRNGCESPAWRLQLEQIDHFAETLRRRLPRGTALVVVADHGMVDVPVSRRGGVDDEPARLRGGTGFGGEARFRHLYCDDGVSDAVATRWRERLGSAAIVLTRDEAVGAGWFGTVSASVRPRLGDVVVASIGEIAVVSRTRFAHEAVLVGLHGSLTPDEMLVPLLVDAP